MIRKFLAASVAAAALALGIPGAWAHAYVTGTFAGIDISAPGSGYGGGMDGPIGIAVEPGGSYSQDYTYSITLHNDGLPAERTWNYCVPTDGNMCGPTPTGTEIAEFEFAMMRTKEASPWFQFQLSGIPTYWLLTAAPGTEVTYSGTFTLTETSAMHIEPYTSLDAAFFFATSWVDSSDSSTSGPVASTVPDAPGAALMLAGLAGLALIRRR